MPSPETENRRLRPVICLPFLGAEARLRHMETQLGDLIQQDPDTHGVGVEEAARHPEPALQMRISILSRTYRGDYHTDSFDLPRLTEQVQAGDELIWFWGGASEIARFRRFLRDPAAGEVPPLALGTSTLLPAEAEYGGGYAESCRNGSMDADFGGRLPYIWATYQYITGARSAQHRRYHTIIGTARNRASSAEVRGGEPVHLLASQLLHYRFWGYVPYYVMQGGVLEQLDLVECNRDQLDVLRALRKSPPWLFRRAEEADFASALVEMNFGMRAPVAVDLALAGTGRMRYRLLIPTDPDLVAANHVVVRPVTSGDGLTIKDAVAQAIASEACCAAVHVDLTDPRSLAVQDVLARQGFVFSALVPPKETWFERDDVRHQVDSNVVGLWVRPRPGLSVEQPYYRNRSSTSQAETRVLDYLRTQLNWTGQ